MGMYLSNITSTSDTSSFSTICSNPKTRQKGSIFSWETIISNKTRLTVAITDLIISEGISLKISQKPRLKKMFDLEITASKSYQPPNRNIVSKVFLCNS